MVVCLSGRQLSSRSTRASSNHAFTLGTFLEPRYRLLRLIP